MVIAFSPFSTHFPYHSVLRAQQLLHPLHILGTHLGRWRRVLIIQREIIPGTVIDVVHEAIQCQQGFGVAGLQWDGNIGNGITYGEQIHCGAAEWRLRHMLALPIGSRVV
jgi:hypothetical protein